MLRLLLALTLSGAFGVPALGDDIRERLLETVRKHIEAGLLAAGLTGEVTHIQLPAYSEKLDAASTLRPVRAFIPRWAAGRHVVPIEVTPPGGRPVNLNVTVSTVAVVTGWTVRFAVKRGEPLDPAMFFRKTERVASRERDYVQTAQLPEEFQLVATLQPGQLLRHHHIQAIPAVQAGDAVTIYFISNNITLVAPGKARRRGRIGEMIPVVATATGKRMHGRLEAPGVVVVE